MHQAEPRSRKGAILVVDDEPMVREVATAILRRAGLTVETAEDGNQAIERVATEPGRYSLVLVDLSMPGLSGPETVLGIHEIRRDMPVVMMSGYREEEASGLFDGTELAGFLEKPFSTGALTALIDRILGAEGGQPAG